jgi:hypothetical protein
MRKTIPLFDHLQVDLACGHRVIIGRLRTDTWKCERRDVITSLRKEPYRAQLARKREWKSMLTSRAQQRGELVRSLGELLPSKRARRPGLRERGLNVTSLRARAELARIHIFVCCDLKPSLRRAEISQRADFRANLAFAMGATNARDWI